jgi:hypothetical protein
MALLRLIPGSTTSNRFIRLPDTVHRRIRRPLRTMGRCIMADQVGSVDFPASQYIFACRCRLVNISMQLGLPTVFQNSYTHGNHSAPPPPPSNPVAFGHGAPADYSFQYSNCTGKRKALLIGINYFGQRGQLRGCINDVKNMSTYLSQNFGYAREDMVILTDDQQNPMSQPTKANILRAMHWLVKDARANDSLFFHYSGKFTTLVGSASSMC